jgi:hypothetical protein
MKKPRDSCIEKMKFPLCQVGLEREMNCQEVQNLLSAYVDEELPLDSRSQVSKHLKTCSACADEVASFQSLSQSTAELSHPELPASIWQNVEAQLDSETAVNLKQPETPARTVVFRWGAIAALLLVAVTFGFVAYHNWDGHGHHELAADFSEYLDVFQDRPGDAHLVLVNKYAGKAVELDQAHLQLGYRPTLADGLPNGYTIQTSFVIDMPCCKCIKTICKRSDGGTLAIFEHDDEQPIWFGGRSSTQAKCGGQLCTLTKMDSQIALSWKQGHRHLTIVGLRDTNEASELVAHLNTSTKAPKLTG